MHTFIFANMVYHNPPFLMTSFYFFTLGVSPSIHARYLFLEIHEPTKIEIISTESPIISIISKYKAVDGTGNFTHILRWISKIMG